MHMTLMFSASACKNCIQKFHHSTMQSHIQNIYHDSNEHAPLSTANTTNPMNIVLFLVWKSDVDYYTHNNRQQIHLAYAVITIVIWLRYDYNPTTTYRTCLLPFDAIPRELNINVSIFRRSRIAVELNANRNFDHFCHSRMHRGITVS